MKIKKTGQTAGIIGSVTNSRSNSDTDAYSCSYINGINEYSTEEHIVGTWIDGKPIYRKVMVFDRPTDNIDLTSLNIEELLPPRFIWHKDVNYTVDFNNYYWNESDRIRVFRRNNTLRVLSNTGSNNNGFYLILEYTKTTD